MLLGLGGLWSVITIPNSASSGILCGALYWTPWAGIIYSPWPSANRRCLSLVLWGCLTRFLYLPPPPPLPSVRVLCGYKSKTSINQYSHQLSAIQSNIMQLLKCKLKVFDSVNKPTAIQWNWKHDKNFIFN